MHFVKFSFESAIGQSNNIGWQGIPDSADAAYKEVSSTVDAAVF